MNTPTRSRRRAHERICLSPRALLFFTHASDLSVSPAVCAGCECDHGDLLEGWHAEKVSPIVETAVLVFPLLDLERGRLSNTQCTLKITVRRVAWDYTGI